jgi:hypothetical protein
MLGPTWTVHGGGKGMSELRSQPGMVVKTQRVAIE